MKYKNSLTRFLGVITTVISIAMIYLILFKDGKLRPISAAMLIEFAVVVTITVSTKFFWYTSTESSIRSSDQYLTKRGVVTEAIETNITDAADFDDFVEIENTANYNKYVSNRCKYLTVDNYRLSFFDRLHKLFLRKDKQWYMTRYMLKVERRANRQHKLSGSNIRSLTLSKDGLTDDRNKADTKKALYLWTGAIFSVMSMLLTAAIAFEDKLDIDLRYALIKMAMYTTQILFSILQSVVKARTVVSREDLDYFNRILSIVEKYQAYKVKPYTIEKISYIREVNDDKENINPSI